MLHFVQHDKLSRKLGWLLPRTVYSSGFLATKWTRKERLVGRFIS